METQNEVGGKDLLLKAAKLVNVATTDTEEGVFTVGHGLKVGDVVKFSAVGANTVFNTTNFYFVVEVLDVDSYKLSATKGGTAIEADATEATLAAYAYQTLGGLRSKTFGFTSDGIDITNHDSDEYTKLLDGAGIRAFNVSGSGVYTNETVFQQVFTRAKANELQRLMFIDVKASRVYEGLYKVTSLEVSGDYDGEGSYSISAGSSGALVEFTAA